MLIYMFIASIFTLKNYMRLAILCIMLFFSSIVVTAQLPSDFRTEQIYINPDRHVYLPGDTIGVEGIVRCFAADQVLPYSNYLNIELFDQQDSILVRKKSAAKTKVRSARKYR